MSIVVSFTGFLVLMCYSLDLDQTELASIEIREANMLSEEYRRVIENLRDTIDRSSLPEPTETGKIRKERATTYLGLREKASGFDEMYRW
jgi:hypothetical protein